MKRLLIIDDEEHLRLLYKAEFENDGYQAETAGDAEDALELLEHGKFDLVILDIRMPGMDGLQALERFLDRDNRLPVIINSAYDSYKDNFLSWGAESYVIKSSDMTELKQKVRDALKGSLQES